MRRAAAALGMLAALALSPHAHSQARGPSHSETREKGLHISSRAERQELMIERAMERAEDERLALLDPAERARRFAELEAILRRVSGRFQIAGRIERGRLGGDVKGIADCSAVGESAGLNCIINASWPVVEPPTAIVIPNPDSRGGIPIPSKPPSEALNTMRPAVLVIGLNVDPPGLRAMMVTADTMAFNWVGYLQRGGVNLTRPTQCWTDVRCYRGFQISVRPEGDVVSFVLMTASGYMIRLTLHPDPEATLAAPMKPLY